MGIIKKLYNGELVGADGTGTEVYPITSTKAVYNSDGDTVDEVLTDKADKSTTYTKSEVDTAINTAVADCLKHLTGNSASRPSPATDGTLYFDTDLGFPIWYFDGDWVDASGNVIED